MHKPQITQSFRAFPGFFLYVYVGIRCLNSIQSVCIFVIIPNKGIFVMSKMLDFSASSCLYFLFILRFRNKSELYSFQRTVNRQKFCWKWFCYRWLLPMLITGMIIETQPPSPCIVLHLLMPNFVRLKKSVKIKILGKLILIPSNVKKKKKKVTEITFITIQRVEKSFKIKIKIPATPL